MALQPLYGPSVEVPPLLLRGMSSVGSIAPAMNTAGYQVQCVGQLYLEGGSAGGSKTISPAGGKIHWRSGTTTWLTAGSTLRVGLQDVSAVNAPAQGEGWAGPGTTVYKDLVQGTDAIPTVSAQSTSMATGTKTLAHGDKVAVVFHLSVKNGSDSVVALQYVPANAPGGSHWPVVMQAFPTLARQVALPSVVIEFNDGTLGWLAPSCPILGSQSNLSVSVATATFDEYGNVFTPNVAMRAVGITCSANPGTAAADFELCLYSDPLSVGAGIALVDKIDVDATQLGNGAGFTGGLSPLFTTERVLKVGTQYGISLRPTTATAVVFYFYDVLAASHWKAISLDDSCYAIKRLNNAGAFADYNGGIARTRRMAIALLVDQLDDGVQAGQAYFQLGI